MSQDSIENIKVKWAARVPSEVDQEDHFLAEGLVLVVMKNIMVPLMAQDPERWHWRVTDSKDVAEMGNLDVVLMMALELKWGHMRILDLIKGALWKGQDPIEGGLEHQGLIEARNIGVQWISQDIPWENMEHQILIEALWMDQDIVEGDLEGW
ncbi:hypothetical protein WMY93_005491 [Mugilogobius chulae]|uniref:Uncharacterized protein n=1 Tax=Mugilogobius chulae TaxID=88201 RepID=A0AAW0PTB4_9GOBI